MGEGLFGAWRMRDKIRFTVGRLGSTSDSVAVVLGGKTLHLSEH